MHEKKFGSLKISKLKDRRGNKIIQTSSRIARLNKWGLYFLIRRKLKTLVKALPNYAEFIEI